MSDTLFTGPKPDTAYTGPIPPHHLADLTIAEAWDYSGQDKSAMLAALIYAAGQSKNRRIRRIADLGLTVEYDLGIEAVMWRRPWETEVAPGIRTG